MMGKTLYSFDTTYSYGTFFVDDQANFIGFLHEDDGTPNWPKVSSILEFFDVKIAAIKVNTDQDWFEHDDPERFLAPIKDQVKAAITKVKSTKTKPT